MAANVATISGENDKSSVVIFTSPCGGVGTSTVAAACAIAHANMGKRVFYLNLEQCGTTDVFFQAEGNATMSDVIYSLKSRKANLLLKLESCIKAKPGRSVILFVYKGGTRYIGNFICRY